MERTTMSKNLIKALNPLSPSEVVNVWNEARKMLNKKRGLIKEMKNIRKEWDRKLPSW